MSQLYIVPYNSTEYHQPIFGCCLIDQLLRSDSNNIIVHHNIHELYIDITTVVDTRDDRVQYIILSLHRSNYNYNQYNTNKHYNGTVIYKLYLQHAVQCPSRRAYQLKLQPTNNKSIKLASVILVYDTHNNILLTRRHPQLRIFPCAYVAPGGTLDKYETLHDCATRELYEEAGLICDSSTIKPVYVWESCYPTEVC